MHFPFFIFKTNLIEYLNNIFPGSSAVEQTTVNRLAGGSNPSLGAINLNSNLNKQIIIFQKIFKAIKLINTYLNIFEMDTIIKKVIIGIRRIPATTVRGSPIKGTQLKNKVHFP